MSFDPGSLTNRIRNSLRTALGGPQLLAFLPAITLGGYWYGGEGLLLYMALLFPALFALAGLLSNSEFGPNGRDGVTGLRFRRAAIQNLNQYLKEEQETGMVTAALALSLDDFQSVERQFGAHAADEILAQVADRLQYTLRDADIVARMDKSKFGIALSPMRRSDLETLIQLSTRLQGSLSEPFSVDASRVYVTASVGFCTTSRAPARSGESLLASAEMALSMAVAHGAGSIRAFSPESKKQADTRQNLSAEVGQALEQEQIEIWFQPQISTDTGKITGFEAMPRWEHPKNGFVPTTDFLPSIIDLGLSERLGEILLYQSLSALRDWKAAGYEIPGVSLSLTLAELENPKTCDKIRWELDRFDLPPSTLCFEVLEEVVAATPEDTVVRNLSRLTKMGCRIDLNDFGTGNASISSIRRFSINRIKIAKSFITRVDKDRDQQNMVAAILTMADRLELDTIADGVQTIGEHTMLAQLGCRHVQGFSVARPMPFDQTLTWIAAHKEKVGATVQFPRKTG